MTTQWNAINVAGKPSVTVSPGPCTGAGSSGADFGSDSRATATPGVVGTGALTQTDGIQEAINWVVTQTPSGGTVHLLPGVFQIATFVSINNAIDLLLELDPTARITIPKAAGWGFSSNSLNITTKAPGILIRNSSHIIVRGGVIVQSTLGGVFDTTVCGIWVANSVDDIRIEEVQFIQTQRFAVLINGYANPPGTATPSGPVTNVSVRDCYMLNCGNIGQTDGGGVRIENATVAPDKVMGIWIEDNAILYTNFFGVDVGGGGMIFSVTGVFVRNNLITSQSGGKTGVSGIGVNFEGQADLLSGQTAAATVIGGEISGNHITTSGDANSSGMSVNGILLAPGCQQVSVTDNIVEYSGKDGILLQTGVDATAPFQANNKHLHHIVISGNICRNNNQSGAGGAGIGFEAAKANAAFIEDVLVQGNICSDDQGGMSTTQFAGIRLVSNVSGANPTFQNIVISDNECSLFASHSPINLNLLNGIFSQIVIRNNPRYNPVAPSSLAAFVSGTVYQNTTFSDFVVYMPLTINATGGAVTVTPAVGPASPPVALGTDSIPSGTPSLTRVWAIRVPANSYYSLTITVAGTATATPGAPVIAGE